MIKSISSSNGTGKRFEYDELNRLQTRVDSIDNNNKFTASYSYLSTGEIGNVVLNSAVTMSYEYNTYGYVDQVRTNNQLVWDANSVNEYGIVNNFTLGNQVNTVISYDQYGFVDGITSTKGGTYLQNRSYDFNNITGNLTSRMGLNSSGGSVTESFTYDDLNRLLTCTAGQDTLSVSYDESGYGNITGKTDVGTYDYTGGVHNVTSVTEPTELMQNLPKQFIDYTKSGKVSCITDTLVTEEVRKLNFIYGPDENRVKTLFTVDDAVVRTKYFALDQYEKETDSTGNVRELYYISGADGVVAVLEKKNNQDSIFYIHKDYLGSYEVISNQNGTVKERYNFDPWGRRRNPADWSYNNIAETNFLDRGFTGHEHLDKFGLINMTGRVFDPLMAMFLSPDNFVQSPDLTQNLNRYTYCLNNPLKYSDPSGYSYKAYMDDRYDEGNYWYRGQAPGTWTDWQSYHHIGGGGVGYFYNSYTGQYKNEAWETVDYSEVHNNYIVPNSDFYFSGEIARNFMRDYLSGGDATINRNHIEIKKTDFLGIKGLTLYSYYGFDIDKNRKDYTTSGGVYIKLGYESATGKWVQLVTSSDRPSPFIDTFSKNSYYYPNQWVEDGITIFEDWPLRPWDVFWVSIRRSTCCPNGEPVLTFGAKTHAK